MLSNQQIQNNWPTIKSQVLSKWNKLSEAEVQRTHGEAQSLGKLVHSKYGNHEEFDKTYDKICNTIHSSRNPITNTSTYGEKKFSSTQADGVPDFENRSRTAPSAEAGMSEHDTVSSSYDDTFHAGSPERRANASYAKVEHTDEFNREADDELSHYTAGSRTSELDSDETAEFNKLDNKESNTHFSAPDEFYPSQDPSPSREDITLGRNTSSATKISTAKAAPISSEASNDAKKKI
ncbi:hypothetical protein SHI21_05940 [Bacteriovorax sp. PP10]|uniref:Uncharacterized protein n=1 Tax=Bacteriovorax antarcticus TaxID=3088717 RepID=A0ABU5VRQ6_9BACT|nr:hypothetical protein [Bacteriovorax sp. PP10]MEA9355729.1 hypothetical protein [Bacteriovorax sp. PP10]